MPKQYADVETYEAKLVKVMARLGVSEYDYNWDRHGCWVSFTYKGSYYRFEHSVESAKAHGQNIAYGSDVFAQVVLTLEDIARMTERGIYELQTWIAGLKALPPKQSNLPECFAFLQFSELPSQEELEKRYRALAKAYHPDAGGNTEMFNKLTKAKEDAERYLNGN